MRSNVILLTYKHLYQPVTFFLSVMNEADNQEDFSVAKDPTDQGVLRIGNKTGGTMECWKETHWLPEMLSQEKWSGENVRQGKEQAAVYQEAEL